MADARGEYWYFEPGTDASKITVPELRSILLKHGVTYPASAKKPQLVGLFNDVVAPQAAKVQKAHARTKRSTRGIQDVPSSSASTITTEDTEDETLHAPPPPSARRPVRRSARSPPAEPEDIAPVPRARTPARAIPAKHSRASELDVDERPVARRFRKSETPATKAPPVDPEAWHNPAADSPFTQDNPFQSGSSPAVPETASRDRRRKTMGFEQKERRKSEANRRRTFQPNTEQFDEGIMVPSRRDFDVADPRVKMEEHESADAGEEFTAEEQLELIRERAAAGEVDILPPRPRKQPRKATGALKSMGYSMLFLGLTAMSGFYRQEKIAIGFCGVGRDATSLTEYGVPEPLSEILGDYTPQCEPCPQHAQCFRNLQLTCDRDYIRKEHPLSLNGFWPIPAKCEPDSEKTKKVKAITNRAVSMLRTRRAQYECSEEDADGQVVKSPEMTELELKQQMAEQKSKSTTFQDFNELFDRAFPELLLQEEVVESKDGTTNARLLSSKNLSKLSLSCSIRRSVRESLERYFFQIVAVFAILITTAYGKYSFTTTRATETRAKQLASDVFDRLAEHAALSMQEPGAYPDKGISMAQLRDDVLRNEFSGKRRQKLWERVQKKVEFNSNIRAAVKTTNSGDVARTWEWIGPIKLLEDGRSNKRESGRFSFGMGSSPPSGANDASSVQKWDEGRPIY